MGDFTGKTILITGGTSGIGRATALELAGRGANVVITGRRAAEGEKAVAELRRKGVKAEFVQGDVTDEAHLAAAVKVATAITGKLDGAFNNAGLELAGIPVSETTAENYRKVFDVNVLGVLLAMKHQLRVMQKGAAIVNNASIAGRIGMPGVGVYVGSKHAVIGLTKVAAMEGAPKGVRVNAVSPGAIETEMFDRFTGGSQPDNVKYMASLHPLGRIGHVNEIASAVAFLLSNQSTFMTGHDLVVDGGLTVP